MHVWGRAPREPALSEGEGSSRAQLGSASNLTTGTMSHLILGRLRSHAAEGIRLRQVQFERVQLAAPDIAHDQRGPVGGDPVPGTARDREQDTRNVLQAYYPFFLMIRDTYPVDFGAIASGIFVIEILAVRRPVGILQHFPRPQFRPLFGAHIK